MDEAERLCDRVAIVEHGKIMALDTPRELIATLGGEHVIEFSCECDAQGNRFNESDFMELPTVTAARSEGELLCLSVREPHLALPALLDRIANLGCRLTSLTTRNASLEDVFVKLAGRHLSDNGTENLH
jgi:ABC-2 type transport system ATP-binding protein